MVHLNPDPPSHSLAPSLLDLRDWLWPMPAQSNLEHVPAHALIGGKVGRLPTLVSLIE